MLSVFPMCIKGWLYMLDTSVLENNHSDCKSCTINPWQKRFCILLENDSKFFIYDDEPKRDDLNIPAHLSEFRLDNLIFPSIYSSSNFLDEVSTLSSKNQDSDRYASNSSLNQGHNHKSSKIPFFRNGSRLFTRAKSSTKINTCGKDHVDMHQQAKSVSTLKRTQSLSRIIRKKSEEKNLDSSKSPTENFISKNNSRILMAQSTGDLTAPQQEIVNRISELELNPRTLITDVHPSLVGEQPFCFCISGSNISSGSSGSGGGSWMGGLQANCESGSNTGRSSADSNKTGSLSSNTASILNNISTSGIITSSILSSPHSRIFAARSLLEKQCWMKRLDKSARPNLDNENRYHNWLSLTIYECKGLSSPQKRKYYCDIYLDKMKYARTTSKISNEDGSVFWAEDLVLDKVQQFKNLLIYLYKEPDAGKDGKKRKKKGNQCLGQCNFSSSFLNSNKSEYQSWVNISTGDLLRSDSSIQLRVKLKYQSLKVLTSDYYNKLEEMATKHHLELLSFLEKTIPIKLKEEIAHCLVNIHEKNGTIVDFLTEIITKEVSDLDLENNSMSLRANTIVTKIIESHMKLVGLDYLYSMLHPLIRQIMLSGDSASCMEVDPAKIDCSNSEEKEKLILDNQHRLLQYLQKTWDRIYESRLDEFPKQLKLIFAGWRNKLLKTVTDKSKLQSISQQCNLIVSACIFLRLICPAILSPHLFGLVSHFSDNQAVHRTLTLIAKSLQSLANFSKFGEKEDFMLFMNPCFEVEMPRMFQFLHSISSFDEDLNDVEFINQYQEDGMKDVGYYGSVIDMSVELARLHNCLASDSVKDSINKAPKIHSNIFNLPKILYDISQKLDSFSVSPTSTSISGMSTSMSSTSKRINAFSNNSSTNIYHQQSSVSGNSNFTNVGHYSLDICKSSNQPNSGRRMSSGILSTGSGNSGGVNLLTRNSDSKKQQVQHQQYQHHQIQKDVESQDIFGEFPHYSNKIEPEYCDTREDIWQKRTDNINSGSKSIGNTPPTIMYSTKSQYSSSPLSESINPLTRTNLPSSITTAHKGHYFTHESDNVKHSSLSSKHTTHTNKNNYNVGGSSRYIPKKPIPFQPKKAPIKTTTELYSNVNDPEFCRLKLTDNFSNNRREIQTPKSLKDKYCYQENPLYDYVGSSSLVFKRNSVDNISNNSIERFFSTRSKVSQLEQKLQNSDISESQSASLTELHHDLENMKVEVQNEQLRDLRQLKLFINQRSQGHHSYSSSSSTINTNVDGGSTLSRQKQLVESNNTTDALDEVIKTINIDGAGLDEAQQSLRQRNLHKNRPHLPRQNQVVTSRTNSGSLTTNKGVKKYNTNNVLSDDAVDSTGNSETHRQSSMQSLNSMQSQSSCSSSSVISGLI